MLYSTIQTENYFLWKFFFMIKQLWNVGKEFSITINTSIKGSIERIELVLDFIVQVLVMVSATNEEEN